MPNVSTGGKKFRDMAGGRDPAQHTWFPSRFGDDRPDRYLGVITNSAEAVEARGGREATAELNESGRELQLRSVVPGTTLGLRPALAGTTEALV